MRDARADPPPPEPAYARTASWLGFLPLRIVRVLLRNLEPERAARVGAVLGRTIGRLGGARAQVARINLQIAFPDWTDAMRRRVLLESYANMGRGIAELAVLQGPHREALLAGVELEGLEHLAAAEAASSTGGVVVLTAHFGSWDLCAAALANRGLPVSVVHRGFENPRLEQMMMGLREGTGETLEHLRLGSSTLVGVLRALRAGRKVAMLADQNARLEEGVFAPFFSRPACTRVGPALIAMRREIPVLPAFVFRRGTTARHVLRIGPHLRLEPPGADPEAALRRNVTRMNRVIERVIRDAPEQWLWVQRRWKTRPEVGGACVEPGRVYPPRRGLGHRLRKRSRARIG